ncbi:MAG: hypothetical protein KKC75_00640 [Nanoarchaeota archaeon]|nr:hypothetical protein [Nanoarchaeota archaeon]
MKIIKKYDYKLTEGSLDKDIEQFILEARKGAYTWDYKHGMEGLRIIKQYFKLIQKEFDEKNFEICKVCYKKLLSLLFEEGYKYSCFGYEDIIARTKLDFEKIIQNYFLCLIVLHNVEDLFNEYLEYLKAKQEYYFEAAEKTIMDTLNAEDFAKFKNMLLLESKNIKEKDYFMHDILTFLMDIAKKKEKNENEFIELAKKFAPILGYDDFKELIKDYEEDR